MEKERYVIMNIERKSKKKRKKKERCVIIDIERKKKIDTLRKTCFLRFD